MLQYHILGHCFPTGRINIQCSRASLCFFLKQKILYFRLLCTFLSWDQLFSEQDFQKYMIHIITETCRMLESWHLRLLVQDKSQKDNKSSPCNFFPSLIPFLNHKGSCMHVSKPHISKHQKQSACLTVTLRPFYLPKEVYTPKYSPSSQGLLRGKPWVSGASTEFLECIVSAKICHVNSTVCSLCGWDTAGRQPKQGTLKSFP